MKLAVILPVPFQGGVMRSAMNIVRMLAIGAKSSGDHLELSFGFPEGLEFDHGKVETLRDLNVRLRPFQPLVLPAEHIAAYYQDFLPVEQRSTAKEYLAFNDGVSNFEEADLWLIISDHISTPIPPHRKFGVVVYDYVQKYFPDILADSDWAKFSVRARNTCNADFVIATSNQTRLDAITFAGADPGRVHCFPVEFDPPGHIKHASEALAGAERDSPYIMWSTILSQHENHLDALEGVSRFLESNPHRVVLTGFHTKSFDPSNRNPSVDHPYIRSVRKALENAPELRKRIAFKGFVSDFEYGRLMAGAAAVLHTSTGDNGTYTALEAAWLRVQTVCSRYPAMDQLAQQFELPMITYDIEDPISLAEALRSSIEDSDVHRGRLPSHDQLSRFRFDRLAPDYWKRFRDVAACVLK